VTVVTGMEIAAADRYRMAEMTLSAAGAAALLCRMKSPRLRRGGPTALTGAFVSFITARQRGGTYADS
jgi:hypothetical protein